MKMNRKRRSKGPGYNKIIYICIAAVLFLVPTGYGYWTDKLQVMNNITTGYCDLAFTVAEVVNPGENDVVKIQKQNEHNNHEHHEDKQETDIGNRLHILIKSGEPNEIAFTITNYGTAPALFNTQTKVNQPLNIIFTEFKTVVDGDNNNNKVIIPPYSSETGRNGVITGVIKLESIAEEEKNYNLLIDLKSSGWNNNEFEVGKEAIKQKEAIQQVEKVINEEVNNEVINEEVNNEVINEEQAKKAIEKEVEEKDEKKVEEKKEVENEK
ncbi:hypothetical protein [Clostridium sp.]|uniref:hypothetical protein n=1 Tax=Clostridium sp. TaxID=1506 RepID=UPI001A5593CB|nr:hypothetical protein [Clostridium sp.]MBK5240640.1 hypothetical protein [Clostridium sp.]